VQVGACDVLRGEQQEEEEGEVGRRVADELDEGLLHEAAQGALGGQQVDLRKTRRTKSLERRDKEKQEVPHPAGLRVTEREV